MRVTIRIPIAKTIAVSYLNHVLLHCDVEICFRMWSRRWLTIHSIGAMITTAITTMTTTSAKIAITTSASSCRTKVVVVIKALTSNSDASGNDDSGKNRNRGRV